jgi:hypothetical protein
MQHSYSLDLGLRAILVGLVAIGAFSCDGEPANNNAPAGSVQTSDLAVQIAAAHCEGIAACCIAGGFSSDTAGCKASMQAQLNAFLTVHFADSYQSYDAAAAGRCVDAYRAAMTACTNRPLSQAISSACDAMFVGTVALGGPCTTSNDCIQNDTNSVSCDAGICAVSTASISMTNAPRGTLGQACRSTCEDSGNGGSGCSGSAVASSATAVCWVNDGLVCGSSGTCVAVPTLGQSCAGSYHCATGSYCNGNTCAQQVTTGSCSSSSSACASSSYCDSTTMQCTPKKADGAACNGDSECTGGDCLGDRCRVWSVADPGSCAGLLD